MPDGLYDTDALAWAERQSALLARLAIGERVNADVDWEHVVEEIRDVGLSELRRCERLLGQALAHLLKLHLWPDSEATAHWRGETAAFLAGARRSFSPSMRQRIDMADLYGDALRVVRAGGEQTGGEQTGGKQTGGEQTGRAPPEACPFTLDELLRKDAEIADLAARLSRRP